MASISKLHWDLINRLIQETNAIFVVPDYPLTPASGCRETYGFIETLHTGLKAEFSDKRFIFIGDSAGGGWHSGLRSNYGTGKRSNPNR